MKKKELGSSGQLYFTLGGGLFFWGMSMLVSWMTASGPNDSRFGLLYGAFLMFLGAYALVMALRFTAHSRP
jgi:hypothetical protein